MTVDRALAVALVAEVTKKAAVVWLSVAGRPAYPLWCLAVDASLYVVTGPGEQPAPGLAPAETARVTARGDHGGRIITWRATVERLEPGSEAWGAVAPQLAAKRLNATDPAAEVAERWARECAVLRLTPTGDGIEAGEDSHEESEAAAPRPTPASRRTVPHSVRRPG